MSFGILGLTLLAADVGDLIDAKAYEKAYAMTKPARLEGAAWIGFLYESELLDVVRFGRSAEGTKRYRLCRMAFAAAAQRDAVLRTELLGRALSCAQKGQEEEATGLLAGQLLNTGEQDRALLALASLEKGPQAAEAQQKLLERCASRWCRAKLLEMASEGLKGAAQQKVDAALVQGFSDLRAGRAAFQRLRQAVQPKRKRKQLSHFLAKAVLIGRAQKLLASHANQGALDSARAAEKLKPTVEERCAILAVKGRALRKLRSHRKAIKAYRSYLAVPCDDESAPGVYYGLLFSQAVVDSSRLEPIVREAHKRFPAHRLSDDYLFFLAEEHQRRGRRKEAAAVYADLVRQHPDGDMSEEAAWRSAWMAYRAGDLGEAKMRLDAFLRDRATTAVHPTEHQLRARFWRARLQPKDRRRSQLEALVSEHPGTWQALLAAVHLGDGDLPQPLKGVVEKAQAVEETKLLGSDVRYQKAVALIRLELRAQALRLLESIPIKTLGIADLLPLTERLIEAGGASAAVGRLRHAPALRGAPQKGLEAIWRLAFPLPHKTLILAEAKRNGIPPALLFGLIREESGFDAGVLSWAGAKGLTQCMPPTARMVAKRHKVRGYSWARMDEPELNVRIGGLYLGGLLKRWKGVLPMAVGSYNAGPGAMKRMRKRAPNLPMDVWVEEISIRQTREYVQRVLASAWTYAQLYPELGALDRSKIGIAR